LDRPQINIYQRCIYQFLPAVMSFRVGGPAV